MKLTRLYDKKEVAEMLHCSVSKIEKMMRTEQIRFEKIGALVRFRPSDIAPFFEGGTASPGATGALSPMSDGVEKTVAYGAVRSGKK